MRLYAQTILIVGLAVLAVAAVLFVVFELTVMGSYAALERDYVTEDLHRAENAISGEITRLSEIAKDWAVWDDTYSYVGNRSQSYEQSNLAPLTLKLLDISALAIFDLNGSLIAGREYEKDTEKTNPISAAYITAFQNAGLSHDSVSSHAGLIMGTPSPLFVASYPVYSSLMEGPARGVVVVAEPLNSARIDLLSREILRTFSLHPLPLNKTGSPPATSQALFPVGSPLPDTMILTDISGSPILELRIQEPGDMARSGQYSRIYLLLSLIVLTILFISLASWLLNRIIIAPLQVLNRDLLRVGDSGSLSERIRFTRQDEIGDLTRSINTMLASLEESQRERARTEQQLSRLINLVEEGICLIGPDRLIWFANPTMAAIFDTSAHDLTGKDIRSVFSAESGDLIGDSGSASDGELIPGQQEYHTKTGQGRDIWVRVAIAPYPLDTGRMGHLCVITDITPFRTAERELLLSNKKLALLGSMTRHDIVNQLTTIRGMLGLIKRKNADSALVQLITSAEDASERINKHIEFSKEYQKAGIEAPRWQDLRTVWNLAYAMTRRRGLTFTITGSEYEVYADQLLQKVFYNLIDNTLRHGKDVFYITISTEMEGQDLLIMYEDDGGGVSDAMKGRIFDRGVGTGTGWGLFFVHEVLTLTGMSISESGTYGIGVRFIIRVPGGVFRPVHADREENHDNNGDQVEA